MRPFDTFPSLRTANPGMSVLVLIPARMASTRLPGKPLADIAGRPMIVHVAERAAAAGLGRVVVATDTAAVAEAVAAHGFEAVMTRADHPSGSDRIFEALGRLDPAGEVDTVVNVQGDLPTARARPDRSRAAAALPSQRSTSPRSGGRDRAPGRAHRPKRRQGRRLAGRPVAAAGALFHPRHRAVGGGAALPPHRPLRLPARRPGALRRPRRLAAGDPRAAGAAAGAGSRHAHRRRDRPFRAPRRRHARGAGAGPGHPGRIGVIPTRLDLEGDDV